MPQLRGPGCAAELKSFQRLDSPVFADGPRDTLDQLVTVGLRLRSLFALLA
jgi:hypothetical protein